MKRTFTTDASLPNAAALWHADNLDAGAEQKFAAYALAVARWAVRLEECPPRSLSSRIVSPIPNDLFSKQSRSDVFSTDFKIWSLVLTLSEFAKQVIYATLVTLGNEI